MFTDEVKINIKAGKGGDGLVTFDRIKMSLGPTGGRGGNGGNVYLEGVTNFTALNKYRHKKEYWADDGKRGKADRMDGHTGKDIILTVPMGTVAHNLGLGKDIDITKAGEKVLIAKGGFGGRGNFHFRSPSNTTPQEYEEGKPGESFDFLLELRLIADIGLVGLPNAGKSSLLNELTKAEARVASYPFTTLEPNLGTMEDIIIADIPGLIEGAASGRGLGVKFLRHIQRTRLLAHCLSLESEDLMRDYEIVRHELSAFSPELSLKPEIIILTKHDMLDPGEVEKKTKKLKKIKEKIIITSIHDYDSLKALKTELRSALDAL